MGKLNHDSKLTARTAPDVVEGVGLALARLQRAGVKFRARKVGIEGMIGAVMIDFLAKPFAEQKAILDGRLAQLEAMLDSEPAPTCEPIGDTGEWIDQATGKPSTPSPKPKRRKRSG